MTQEDNYSPPKSRVADHVQLESRAVGVAFLAAMLVIGGVCGLGISTYMGYTFMQQHWVYGILVAGFVALFVWSVLTGVRLWRGDPRGMKWSKILFALQIPVITLPGFSYEYFTGISVKFLAMGGSMIGMNLGAGAEFYLDTRITGFVVGANMFALIAFAYLLFKFRPNKPLHATCEDARA